MSNPWEVRKRWYELSISDFFRSQANMVSFFLLFRGSLSVIEALAKRKKFKKFAQDTAKYRKKILHAKAEGDYQAYYGTLMAYNFHLYQLGHIERDQYKRQMMDFRIGKRLSRRMGRLITVEEMSEDDRIAVRNAIHFNNAMAQVLKGMMAIMASYGLFRVRKAYYKKRVNKGGGK